MTVIASSRWNGIARNGRLCSRTGCFRPTTHLKPFCIHHLAEIPAVQEILARWRWLKAPVVQDLVRSLGREPFAPTDFASRLGVVEETAGRYLEVLERLGCVYRDGGRWHFSGL